MMNEYSEQKFEQLLSSLNKKEYPLNKWMEEDESATFDRIVVRRKRNRQLRRWIAAAACLLFIIGIAGIAKFSQREERQEQLPRPVVAKIELPPQPAEVKRPQNAIQKPSHQKKNRKTKPLLRQTTKTPETELPAAEKTEVDIAEEISDLIACIDGLEQQLLSE